jgi:hypothetical protein
LCVFSEHFDDSVVWSFPWMDQIWMVLVTILSRS